MRDLNVSNHIIIIMSCCPHRYPWPSHATFPYRSSPPAGLIDYIPYLRIAAVCMFELVVLLLLGHKWGSIGVHHSWARLCSSSSVLRAWFSWWEAGGRTVGALWGVSARTCLILITTSLCSCHLASFRAVSLASKWCIYTAVSTRPLLGRNCVSFYRSGLVSIWPIAYR